MTQFTLSELIHNFSRFNSHDLEGYKIKNFEEILAALLLLGEEDVNMDTFDCKVNHEHEEEKKVIKLKKLTMDCQCQGAITRITIIS
ncbi:MAG: hypothetical protein KTV77_01805 [Wolbachia endosymbiont of Fragariocoptes setiger]|nr:hypothetical protein [Wolbachia endosymbiont of Fragariocoptes setiger]